MADQPEALRLADFLDDQYDPSHNLEEAAAELRRLHALIGTKLYTHQPRRETEQEPVAWTDRELELIDGMIEVQLHHAAQCDAIANRTMAEKQKGWDMERVALLRKIKSISPRREWQGLTDEEILKAIGWERAEMYMKLAPNFPVDEAKQETLKNARAVERAVWEKNHG